MLGDVHGLLTRGIAAAKAGDKSEAQRYLDRVLFDSAATFDDKAQAHIWLTQLTDDPGEKRAHLEKALGYDPANAIAKRGLAVLDGRLKTEEIIDPDQHAPEAPLSEPQPINAKRFVCPQCGGVMHFEPGGAMLLCAYCGHRQTTFSALKEGLVVAEHDFTVALATAKGHEIPAGLHTFQCRGCQARLLLSGELTKKCPYCGSPHVGEVETQAMVIPEGIIPFAVTEDAARRAFRRWLDKHVAGPRAGSTGVRTTRVRGLYLPTWTFDLSGEVHWRAVEDADNRGFNIAFGSRGGKVEGFGSTRKIVHEGSYLLLEDDLLVPATHKIPNDLGAIFDTFRTAEAVPYDADYLADWPAELYAISVADASLSARQQTLKRGRKSARIQAETRASHLQDFQLTPGTLSVLSYKLLLLPFWLANYSYEDKTYAVAINGQTNDVSGQKPPGALKKFFSSLFG